MDLWIRNLHHEEKVNRLAAFIHYQSSYPRLRSLGTINTYLSGIRHQFRSMCSQLDFFSDPCLKACKSALALKYRADNYGKDRSKLPFTLDMVLETMSFLGVHPSRLNAMLGVAMVMSYFCLFRSSEYLYIPKQERRGLGHAIRFKDVEFV